MSETIRIVYLTKAPIEGDFSKRKRIIYVQELDDLKILAQRFTKGILLFYTKSEGGKLYEIYEVETKYSIFRLKVLVDKQEAQSIYANVLAGGVIQ